jgi:cytochrome P450
MPGTVVDLPSAGPFDPTSPEFLGNPYAKFRELRAKTPICIDPTTGACFLLRFEDVESGLTNITRGHDDGNVRHVHFPGNPFAADGRGHTGPRRVIMPTFSNRGVQPFRERAQEIVDAALAARRTVASSASSMTLASHCRITSRAACSVYPRWTTSPSCATGRGRASNSSTRS